MTQEPDEALLWAREDAAKRWEKDGFSYFASKCRAGKYDQSLTPNAEAYRAGQAGAEARVKELEVEVITYSGMHRQAADEAIGLAIKVEQAKTTEQWQRQKIEELEAILRDLFENPDFQVIIGGNPNMVEGLMARGRAALKGSDE